MSHIPVLLHETLTGLRLKKGETVVDGTLGYAGHAKEICQIIGRTGRLIGLDQDKNALAASQKVLTDCTAKKTLIQGNFRNIKELLAEKGIGQIDALLLDLGLNSVQLEEVGRGFSFNIDAPLIMTFYTEAKADRLTADDIVNDWAEEDISNVLYGYGEERYARRIAKAIARARQKSPIRTTAELVAIITQAVPAPYRHGRIHLATRTFQALRIAVNDELNALREGLRASWQILAPNGRMAIISFHSLEARIVKNFFKDKKASNEGEILTKKVIKPSLEEIRQNPRSRSAQLRIIKKS